MDGWWINIYAVEQKSPSIVFYIGPDRRSAALWRTWHNRDSLEFDVPHEFKHLNQLYVRAETSNGRRSWFCRMYKRAGVRRFDFRSEEHHEVKQSDHDAECIFVNPQRISLRTRNG